MRAARQGVPAGAAGSAHAADSHREQGEHRLDSMERLLRRIAYDLHDGPVQVLSAAILELEMARQHGACDFESPNVQRVQSLLGSAVDELREISSTLCPRELETDGLLTALERFVDDKRQHNPGVAFVLDVDGSGPDDCLSLSARIALFRIVQEGANNATKHADPTRVTVMLRRAGSEIVCTIDDDGHGFESPVDEVRERSCHGLACMEDRALLLGGDFRVSSKPGTGTTVSVRLPVWS